MTRAILAGLVAAFILLSTAVTLAHGPWLFDAPVLLRAEALRTDGLSRVMGYATDLGGYWVMTLAALGAALVVLRKRRRTALFLALALSSSALANAGFKALFHRDRPSVVKALILYPGGTSFPSGHSQASMAFALTLVLVAWRFGVRGRRLAVLLLFPLFIGASRVYLGVHYPSDVVGGWLLGATIVVAAHWLIKEQEEPPVGVEATKQRSNE